MNARSLVNKFDEFLVMVESTKPGIVAVTETWLHSDIADAEVTIPGYSAFRADRVRRRGGGCILYVHNTINARETKICQEQTLIENVWCVVMRSDGSQTLFGVVYNPPGTAGVDEQNLCKVFQEAYRQYTHVIICGDFNYPNIDWSADSCTGGGEHFLDVVNDCFLTQHVEEATRDDNILDLVFSSEEEMIQDVEVCEPLANSDHNIVQFKAVVSGASPHSQVHSKVMRNFKRANWQEMKRALNSVDWDLALTPLDSDRQWCSFSETLNKLVAKHVPIKKHSSVKKPRWMNRESLKAVKRKRKKWKKYRETGSDEDYLAYKRCLNESTNIVRDSKWNFESKLAENVKKDAKSFYAYARDKVRCKVTVGPIEDDDGVLHTDAKDQAEILNKNFVSVFTEEDDSSRPTPKMKFTGKDDEKLINLVITEDMIIKKLLALNASKAPGVDNIAPSVLINLADAIAYPLRLIFQSSLDKQVVPSGWREANVVPIFKKGRKCKAGNYRPVSLTSQLGKVMESIIRDAINDHLDRFNLIGSSQHGFVKGKSCLTNLLEYLEDMTKLLDEKKNVDVVYLDYAKAFDKVPHKRLGDKVRALGIDGNIANWIQAWLSDRRQRVVLNGDASVWASVTSGVPQGSILGPTLFLVFINDLDDDMLSKVLKFADDTKIYGDATDVEGRDKIQHDLDVAMTWSEQWLMQYNVDKCKTLHAGYNNTEHKYKMGGIELTSVEEERDLGVVVCKSLSVSRQCAEAAKSANRALGQIRRTITNKSKDIVVPLYRSLVRPRLEYCIQAWRPYLKKDITLLEKVQHRATKIVEGMNKLSYEERLVACDLQSLEERRDRGDMIEVHKIVKGMDRIPSSKFFKPLESSHSQRGQDAKFFKQRSRLDIRKYFFSQRVVNKWNALPQTVVDATSTNVFKGRYDKHRMNKLGVQISPRLPTPSAPLQNFRAWPHR